MYPLQSTIVSKFVALWPTVCAPPLGGKILQEDAEMNAKFDIFRKLPDGQPIWVKAVEGLEEAKRQLLEMENRAPGDYFIYDTRYGCVLTA